MPGAKDENFDGLTIAYNGVQFGGADSEFKSQPPQYRLKQRAVYDEAGRAVTHIRYVLTVLCTFYEDTQGDLSANMDAVRSRLLTPGQSLEISGIGYGFLSKTSDMIWGPRPIDFDYVNVHGVIAVDTMWVCEFNGPACSATTKSTGLFFSAVNSESSYSNDFEGKTTRTITGYYEIPQNRQFGLFGGNTNADNGPSKKNLDRVADFLRDGIKVVVPFGFRRRQNTWKGNKSKNRVDFTVIDESLPGRAYPVGITNITNDRIRFETNPFTATQGTVTLTATMTVSPKFAPSLAGLHFFALAKHKQNEMVKKLNGNLGALAKGKAMVLPTRLVIDSGIFDNARTSSFLMQWTTSGCLSNILFHSPWSAVVGTDYTQWKKSVDNLWGNTGHANLRDNKSNDVIITICDPKADYKTGENPVKEDIKAPADIALLPCPDIPEDASWLSYDVEVTYHEKRNTDYIKRMVPGFIKSVAKNILGAPTTTLTKMVLGDKYNDADDAQDIAVQNGPPDQWILLRAKGRRVQHKPVFPQLTSVGGVKLDPPIDSQITLDTVVGKFGQCVILEMKGWAWYKAPKYIADYGPKDNPVFCATTQESSPKV